MTATYAPLEAPDVQPDPPKPRRSRKFRYARNGLVIFVGLAVIGGIASASGSHKTASAVPAVTAPAPQAPAATAPAAPVVTAMDTWCAGSGWTDLQAVEADSAAMGAGNAATIVQDAPQLTADAEAAEGTPPPVTTAAKIDYIMSMGAASFAGTDYAAGDFAAGNTAIAAATRYINDDAGLVSCS